MAFSESPHPKIEQELDPRLFQDLGHYVKQIRWIPRQDIEFNGSLFTLILQEDDESSPDTGGGEFHRAPDNSGWDLFVSGNLPDKTKQRIVFNLMLQCNLTDIKYDKNKIASVASRAEQSIYGDPDATH